MKEMELFMQLSTILLFVQRVQEKSNILAVGWQR